MQQFGGFDSVWMPMVATSNTYIESKIQGHLSYQFCFCINTVVTIIEKYFSCQSVYTLFWATLYIQSVSQTLRTVLRIILCDKHISTFYVNIKEFQQKIGLGHIVNSGVKQKCFICLVTQNIITVLTRVRPLTIARTWQFFYTFFST